MHRSLITGVTACLAVFFLFVITGCGGSTRGEPAGTIVDDLGRNVVVARVPQRIVSLAPSTTEILFELGLGARVVGVDSFSDFPEEAKTREKVGGFADTDIEKVVSLQPDLVVAANIHKVKVIPALEKLGLTVVGLDAKDLDGVIADVRLIGKITSENEKAAKLANTLEKRMNAVASKTASLSTSQKPRVFVVVWQDPLWSTGRATLENDLVVKAGGTNVASELIDYQMVSLEKIVAADPQVILAFGGTAMGGTVEWAKTEPRLAKVSARTSTPPRVYEASDSYKRPSPRAFDALEELARTLHPGLP